VCELLKRGVAQDEKEYRYTGHMLLTLLFSSSTEQIWCNLGKSVRCRTGPFSGR